MNKPFTGKLAWKNPTTYIERFREAVALLCREEPPLEMVEAYLDKTQDDMRLQEFAVDHAPTWAQGIAILDAAHVMADQPTEGVDHEMRQDDEKAAAEWPGPIYDHATVLTLCRDQAYHVADHVVRLQNHVTRHKVSDEMPDGPLPNEPKPCLACDPSVGFKCDGHAEGA
jgi:hypothetical protein